MPSVPDDFRLGSEDNKQLEEGRESIMIVDRSVHFWIFCRPQSIRHGFAGCVSFVGQLHVRFESRININK